MTARVILVALSTPWDPTSTVSRTQMLEMGKRHSVRSSRTVAYIGEYTAVHKSNIIISYRVRVYEYTNVISTNHAHELAFGCA
jgi:hypothetical protein